MKKIAIFLIVLILLSLFSVNFYAEEGLPLFAEISAVNNGEVSVSVYGTDIKKLVSLNLQLKYDTSVFCYKNGEAASYYDEASEEHINNFSGLWVFGELADDSGCTGVLVSSGGSSRSGDIKICEFVLGLTGEVTDETKITLNVNELVTEDGDYLNDIYWITPIKEKNLSVTYDDLFSYKTESGKAEITKCYYTFDYIKIPEKIGGFPVASLNFSDKFLCDFLIIPDNVTEIKENSVDSGTLVICPAASVAEAFAQNEGLRYFTYSSSELNAQKGILITQKQLLESASDFVGGNAQCTSVPSHNYVKALYGTGSTINITNAEKNITFSLCVKGDLNGDSYSDALDCVECERAVNDKISLNDYEKISADLNEDEKLSVEDYVAIVNKSLSK